MQTFKLPQLAWYGTRSFDLTLPDEWQVEVCHMAGYNRPAMKPAAIAAAIAAPRGTPPLREMARGKQEVVIIFDDMTRVTRTYEIVPAILEELAQAGIVDSQIRFVMALGCHGAEDRIDFVKKLGADVVARFPVYNHNPFMNCSYVGTTRTYGTKVYVNDEVMKCDLKIAIGSVVSHVMSGFGGGGKIILPGVAGFETVVHNHRMLYRDLGQYKDNPVAGMGICDKNPMHKDIEEAAELSHLDFLVNALVNEWGETVSLYAGALKPAYAAALAEAKENYRTARPTGMDIVIANTFAKANESFIGLVTASGSVSREGGDIVLVANAPDGQVVHYLLGPFGNTSWGPVRQTPARIPRHVKHEIIFTEYPDLASQAWFDKSERLLFINQWPQVLDVLKKEHGPGTRVALFPSAEIQYCCAD